MTNRKGKPRIIIDENSYENLCQKWPRWIGREIYLRIVKNRKEVKNEDDD